MILEDEVEKAFDALATDHAQTVLREAFRMQAKRIKELELELARKK